MQLEVKLALLRSSTNSRNYLALFLIGHQTKSNKVKGFGLENLVVGVFTCLTNCETFGPSGSMYSLETYFNHGYKAPLLGPLTISPLLPPNARNLLPPIINIYLCALSCFVFLVCSPTLVFPHFSVALFGVLHVCFVGVDIELIFMPIIASLANSCM